VGFEPTIFRFCRNELAKVFIFSQHRLLNKDFRPTFTMRDLIIVRSNERNVEKIIVLQ